MVFVNRSQTSYIPIFMRDDSMDNLNLEEFQSHVLDLSKPLNAMRVDEQLNSVIAVEQQIHSPPSLSSPECLPALPESYNLEGQMELLRSSMPVFRNAIINGGFSDNQQMGMPIFSMGMVRSKSLGSLTTIETNRSDENVDKSIERKQKRMIKNRESAARSRARKQAYINHLEEEVSRLVNENKQLKKQMEEEMLSHGIEIREPRHQLRRTSSEPR